MRFSDAMADAGQHHTQEHAKARTNKCNYCDKVYKFKNKLIAHIFHIHANTGSHACQHCAAILPNAAALQRHIRAEHTSYPCNLCHKVYKSRTSLNAHQRIHHLVVDNQPAPARKHLICEICGYSTRISCNLIVHMRRHTGERPFCCDSCGKCFTALYQLRAHQEIHAPKRLHKCTQCGVAYYQRKALLHHHALHLEYKKYACSLCGKSYAQAAGLSQHKRWHKTQQARATAAIAVSHTTEHMRIGTYYNE